MNAHGARESESERESEGDRGREGTSVGTERREIKTKGREGRRLNSCFPRPLPPFAW